MNSSDGFSLAEVLVSLLLLTTTTLALVTQQWHVSQLFNQTHDRMNGLLQADNIAEQNE